MTNALSLSQLQEQVARFSPQQKRLLKERLQQVGVSVPSRGGRLIGFYQAGSQLEDEELRALCTSRLPAHMVPQRFIQQDTLALTPTGKLDRSAMRMRLWSATEPVVNDQDVTAARNDIEATLADIWSDVLGINEVSVFDNFFEVGGDSLQIIRILSRASKAGMTIRPDAIFAHPTIAELAQLVEASDVPGKSQVVAHGPVPLLPIQSWFFDVVHTHRHHWNQSHLFRLKSAVSSESVFNACARILTAHAGLRAQFSRRNEAWTCTIAESMNPFVKEHQLESQSRDDQLIEMKTVSDQQNANMDLAGGPLFKIIHFKDAGGKGYLNLIAHHLVVDAVSWQIVISDLQHLLRSGRAESATGTGSVNTTSLVKPTSPIKQWAEELRSLVKGSTLNASADYWQAQARSASVDLPVNGHMGAGNPEGECKWVTRELDEPQTERLRTQIPGELRASVQELLLSALMRVLAGWTNRPALTLDLEGHGREPLVDGVDVSQTVGWFTTAFPVNFVADSVDDWASPVGSLKRLKEQLRAVPEKGLSYGLFKYLEAGTVEQSLSEAAPSNILFNYLGVETLGEDPSAILSLVDDRFGVTRHADTERAYELELNAVIRKGRLTIDWAFGPAVHSQDQIERLADEMMINITDLIDGTDSSTVVSPTDFPMAGLDQAALDNLSSQLDGLDDE